MDERVDARVRTLELEPHPEGGFYRETYRSDVRLPALAGYPGPRVAVTSILFLLPAGRRSRLHRVRSEELWLFHEGDPLQLHTAHAPLILLKLWNSMRIRMIPRAIWRTLFPPSWRML